MFEKGKLATCDWVGSIMWVSVWPLGSGRQAW